MNAMKETTELKLDPARLPAGKISELADHAALRGEHTEAERLYLLAAAKSAATSYGTGGKHAKEWDRCAARQRRLAAIAKGER